MKPFKPIIFTFHYVSIKSIIRKHQLPPQKNLHSTMYLLNPNDMIKAMNLLVHLHSTMYLLNQCRFCPCPRSHQHLHSTMYLLNPAAWHSSYRHHLQFTFHYVSIKSMDKGENRSKENNLHSTMYLLNRYPHLHACWVWMLIYIPLCIY